MSSVVFGGLLWPCVASSWGTKIKQICENVTVWEIEYGEAVLLIIEGFA